MLAVRAPRRGCTVDSLKSLPARLACPMPGCRETFLAHPENTCGHATIRDGGCGDQFCDNHLWSSPYNDDVYYCEGCLDGS